MWVMIIVMPIIPRDTVTHHAFGRCHSISPGDWLIQRMTMVSAVPAIAKSLPVFMAFQNSLSDSISAKTEDSVFDLMEVLPKLKNRSVGKFSPHEKLLSALKNHRHYTIYI
jgi:hypothetical protein